MSLEIFGRLGNRWTSSDIIGPYEKSGHSQDKNVTPMNQKNLASIQSLLKRTTAVLVLVVCKLQSGYLILVYCVADGLIDFK